MLDQNTDRMWYVIGAVIVGAAIIMIMNGTMPELFASVGEMFQGKVEQSTEVTDGIMPVQREQNILQVEDMTVGTFVLHTTGEYTTEHAGQWYSTTDFVSVEAGATYYMSNIGNGIFQGGPRLVYYNADKQYVLGDFVGNAASYKWTVPEGVSYLRFSALDEGTGIKETSINVDGQYDRSPHRNDWVLVQVY